VSRDYTVTRLRDYTVSLQLRLRGAGSRAPAAATIGRDHYVD